LREQFGGGTGPLAEELVAEAEEILGRLAVAPPSLLLHGDLHHGNVLRRGSGFCAIDPHGVIGNPLFEAAAMMHNPHRLAGVELRPILRRRVEVLSEVLSWDADSIRLTGLAGAMLSAVWTWEDDGVVAHDALAVAQALRSL
jgi:streptomycin 6-kinase